MSRKIIGVTVGSSLPKPSFDQTDPSKGDFIRGDRSFLNMDTTLTESGRPADAKSTGDAINNVQLNIDRVSSQFEEALTGFAERDSNEAEHNDIRQAINTLSDSMVQVQIITWGADD